jgi:predicted transcriptional regulator
MTLFPESSEQLGGRAVLLSVKPRFCDQILAGSKRVEFRRSWPAGTDIGVMVLYSSSPVQQLVGVAFVDHVEERDDEGLWALACQFGGGLERDELTGYFHGKKKGYGILINDVKVAPVAVDPKNLFQDFRPPQSYQYLSPEEFSMVMDSLFPGEEK